MFFVFFCMFLYLVSFVHLEDCRRATMVRAPLLLKGGGSIVPSMVQNKPAKQLKA